MNESRKITVILPDELIVRATRASGEGLTPTIRRGLELVAAKDTYTAIEGIAGKYKKKQLGISLGELREDKKK